MVFLLVSPLVYHKLSRGAEFRDEEETGGQKEKKGGFTPAATQRKKKERKQKAHLAVEDSVRLFFLRLRLCRGNVQHLNTPTKCFV